VPDLLRSGLADPPCDAAAVIIREPKLGARFWRAILDRFTNRGHTYTAVTIDILQ